MIDLRQPSPFIELAAVEAWDAWFRWRDHTGLHDVSIEDTWRRVSTALASVEPDDERARWRTRFMDALASWRLLPDERLLADAGTGRPPCSDGTFHAALNAAAFVSTGRCANASFDLDALSACAALAVRALDDAALLAAVPAPRLRIGILGIADALALLGLAYDSDAGRGHAAAAARALAEGCLRGSIMLAAARGAHSRDAQAPLAYAESRGTPMELLHDAARHGVRHMRLTAITPQPRLALLANDVADAADPLWGKDHARVIAGVHGPRMVRSSGYALSVMQTGGGGRGDKPDTLANLPWTAQIAMRIALQPWIDEPIAYPLLATRNPDETQRLEARNLAARHGLGEPAWRNPNEPLPL